MDKSQWLPKGTPIVNAYRARMAGISVEYDAAGEIKYARSIKSKTILQWLHENHLLDDLEYECGRDYEMWRNMFHAFCSNQRMTANYGESAGNATERGPAREMYYSKLIRLVPLKYMGYINAAVDHEAKDFYLIRHYAEIYQRAFNRLGAAMDIVREEIIGNA